MADTAEQPDERELDELREKLVATIESTGHLRTPAVEEAFRAVPRHLFLPDLPPREVYQDRAIVTKTEDDVPVSSSTQPTMMAIMLEQLELRPGDRVLEIGTATGYNAALMTHIVGPEGSVVTIDIDEDIVRQGEGNLKRAGFPQVEVHCGDGGFGYPEKGPYDRIILTVATSDIAPAWHQQLAPNGRLVLPLALVGNFQESIAFVKTGEALEAVSHRSCGFVTLRGEYTRQEESARQVGPEPGLQIQPEPTDPASVDPDAIYRLLPHPGNDIATGIRVTAREMYNRAIRWLAMHIQTMFGLVAHGAQADSGIIPHLVSSPGKYTATAGTMEGDSMALLISSPGEPPTSGGDDQTQTEIWIRSYGESEEPAMRLLEELRRWEREGRPAEDETMRISAYPIGTRYASSSGDIIIRKEHVHLVLSWG